MKTPDHKNTFIKLRAEGKSYSFIANELNISKSTCTSWERELKDHISHLKSERLNELYDSYYMTREARIKKLGDTLESINKALETIDLQYLAPEKLLDLKLRYTEALKSEYIPTAAVTELGESFNAKDIVKALGNLLDRIRTGEVTTEQANRESLVLSNPLKAYETVVVKEKLEALEIALGGRK